MSYLSGAVLKKNKKHNQKQLMEERGFCFCFLFMVPEGQEFIMMSGLGSEW